MPLPFQVPYYTPTSNSFTGSQTSANGAGVCTLASTDYVAVVATVNARYMRIGNTHATADIYVNELGSAANAGVMVGTKLGPGGGIVWDYQVPATAIHVASPTASATYFVVVA